MESLVQQAINPTVMASTLRLLGLPSHLAPKTLDELEALNHNLGGLAKQGVLNFTDALASLTPHRSRFLEWDTRMHAGQTKTPDLSGQTVAIIGAGMSGLIFAKHLSKTGASVTVYEQSAVPGGTWGSNSYEGARVDIGGLVYWPSSFHIPSFRNIFPTEAELFRELREVAEALSVTTNFLYENRVTGLIRQSNKWKVTSRYADANGLVIPLHRNFDWVVLAIGRLRNSNASIAKDNFPDNHLLSPGLRNLEKFENKLVTVVGAAASGVQVASGLNRIARKVWVIQSSAHYFSFNRLLAEPVSQGQTWLEENVPSYRKMLRAYFVGRSIRGNLDAVTVDPGWRRELSVSRLNSELRDQLLEDMFRHFRGSDIPDSTLTPNFPPGAKRILQDNGDYPEIFLKGASLILSRAAAPLANGITLENGDELRSDFVVWATGYKIQPPHFPIVDEENEAILLADAWKSRQEAFLGVMDWRFPNLFFAWGPNSNVVVHGSNTHMMEIQADFFVSLLDESTRHGHKSAAVKQESQDNYTRWLDSENRRRAWGVPGVQSWYRNSNGFVTENYPGDTEEYFSQMQESKGWRDFRFA